MPMLIMVWVGSTGKPSGSSTSVTRIAAPMANRLGQALRNASANQMAPAA